VVGVSLGAVCFFDLGLYFLPSTDILLLGDDLQVIYLDTVAVDTPSGGNMIQDQSRRNLSTGSQPCLAMGILVADQPITMRVVSSLPAQATADFVTYRSRIVFPKFTFHAFIVPEYSINDNSKNNQPKNLYAK
jgi:hypothetical protein